MGTQQDDRALAREALAQLRNRPRRLTVPNGGTVQFPKAAVDGLIQTLEAIADGDTPTVIRTPRELTTQQAASALNVSRPTVIRLVDEGRLAARMVGTHRRVPASAVLKLREEMIAERRQALDDMVADAEALGLYE